MPGSGDITTGLLSLCVHETLNNLDDIEIALHPELFLDIQGGDMIEIQVWDPKPRGSYLRQQPKQVEEHNQNNHEKSRVLLTAAASKLQNLQDIEQKSRSHIQVHKHNKQQNIASSTSSLSSSPGTPKSKSFLASSKFAPGSLSWTQKLMNHNQESNNNISTLLKPPIYLQKGSLGNGESIESVHNNLNGNEKNSNDIKTPTTVKSLEMTPKLSPIPGELKTSNINLSQTNVPSTPTRNDNYDNRSMPQGLEAAKQASSEREFNNISSETNSPTTSQRSDRRDILDSISISHNRRLSFVMLVTDKHLVALKSSGRTQISMHRQVADLYNLSGFDMVTVTKINKRNVSQKLKDGVSADFLTVTIKDQYISRGEMHLFLQKFQGRWIYRGERLGTDDGIRASAMVIRHASRAIKSGVVTADTKITFRSRSSRIIWLVQISSEMWDYASPYEARNNNSNGRCTGPTCEIYFDKFTSFMYKLFEKWNELEVTHSLTIIFFSRTFINSSHLGFSRASRQSSCTSDRIEPNIGNIDVDPNPYEDHFKVVVENIVANDWDSIVHKIKKEFLTYPYEVGWNLSRENNRIPSTAAQGNLLEAINTTLNQLQLHYMDRDLHRTGNSIVVVSAGSGVFEVEKGLASVTKQRMMDNGIGSDMLSLGLPPLHVAPFFLYKHDPGDDSQGFNSWKSYFEIPHWMHLSFVSYDKEVISSELAEKVSSGSFPKSYPEFSMSNIVVGTNGFILQDETVQSSNPQRAAGIATVQNTQQNSRKNSTSSQKTSDEADSIDQVQRHLISGRDFEDILEACRPRNRGESGFGMPSALTSLLKKYIHSKDGSNHQDVCTTINTTILLPPNISKKQQELMNVNKSSNIEDPKELPEVTEWGTINFNDHENFIFSSSNISPVIMVPKSGSPNHARVLNQEQDYSGSDTTSPSSSFTSNYSYLLGRSPGSYFLNAQPSTGIQLQPSLSFDIPLICGENSVNSVEGKLKNSRSDGSLSTRDADDPPRNLKLDHSLIGADNNSFGNNIHKSDKSIIGKLKNFMDNYDSSVFSSKNLQEKSSAKSSNRFGNTRRGNSQHEVSDLPSNSFSQRGKPMSGTVSKHQIGGIGAALTRSNSSHQHNFPNADPANSHKLKNSSRSKSTNNFHKKTPKLPHQASSFGTLPKSQVYANAPMGLEPPERLQNRSYNTFKSPSLDISQHRIQPYLSMLVSKGANPHHFVTAKKTTSIVQNRKLGTEVRSSSDLAIPKETANSLNLNSQKKQQKRTEQSRRGKSKKIHQSKRAISVTSNNQKTSNNQQYQKRKPWVLNPFRQEDELEVLAKRTHNRRRWSHVFPQGEIEFKRHAGPNWKSLCQPAILPVTIDIYPSPTELNDPLKFQISQYSVTLDAMDSTHYKTHADLLMEMVRLRLVNDFQLVPQSVVRQSKSQRDKERTDRTSYETPHLIAVNSSKPSRRPVDGDGLEKNNDHINKQIEQFLSMGHKIQVISYNSISDAIDVVSYTATFAHNFEENTYTYNYLLWSSITQSYEKVCQKFKRFPQEYPWNRVDNLICGDQDKTLSEGTRYRRLSFRIIPERFSDNNTEQEYVKRFKKLLDYISKQVQKELDVKIVTKLDRKKEGFGNKKVNPESLRRYPLQLRKGKRDKYEWMELFIDSHFDTSRTYRILCFWLVASASKVDAQIQLLHRRCVQFGLRLVAFPQLSVASDIFIHPFVCPFSIAIRDKDKSILVEKVMVEKFCFIIDGKYPFKAENINCISDFSFPRNRSGRPSRLFAQHYVHHSGLVFIRILTDQHGWSLFVLFENKLLIKNDKELSICAKSICTEVRKYLLGIVS